uniref:EGF-like domain-containing protein n=1 Tax=Biomphalaria glabrata TaxID=6526 RepID=A0A2C9KAS6_BIOGL
CPLGFAGELCEVDINECLHLPCLNNGTCLQFNGDYSCTCLTEQTHNFDLYFDGTDHSAVLIPTLNASKLQELTLCLWFNIESESSYLSLETDHMPLVSLRNSNKMSSYIMNNSVQIQRMDGLWHQFCFVLNSINWFVYLDGLKTLLGETKEWTVNKSLKLTLGQKLGVEDEDRVRGHLCGVNIYSQALTEDNIKNMSISCQQRENYFFNIPYGMEWVV